MTITWEEAIAPVDAATYRDQNLAALEDAGSKINAWGPDAPQTAYLESESRAEAAESVIISTLARTASTQLVVDAGASWVDAVMTFFDIERIPALPCVWNVNLIMAVAQIPFTIDSSNASGIQAMASDGTIFQCTQQTAVTFTTLSLRQGQVEFTALIPGHEISDSSITRLISGPAGLEVVYPEGPQDLITQARSLETSAQFIARGLGRWGVIFGNPNGTAGWTRTSFDFLIPHYAPSVTRWSVDDANPNGPGTVQVAVANEDGPGTVQEVADVSDGLNGIDIKPVGSGALTVVAATAVAVTINATIKVDGSNADVGAQATSALEALGNAFPLGPATLPVDLVISSLMGRSVAGAAIQIGSRSTNLPFTAALNGFASVINVTALDFVADLDLTTGEVLVITAVITVDT